MSWKYTATGNEWKYTATGSEWKYTATGSEWKYTVALQESESVWLLETGFWNDDGVWVDGAIMPI